MSSVNAGRVELDIVAIAKDQVSATLREVNKSLAGTKAQMEGVRAASNDAGAAQVSLHDKLKGTYTFQERFNKLLGLGGFIGIIGGAVSGLVEFINSMDSYRQSMAVVAQHQKAFNDLLKELEQLNKRNAEAGLDAAGKWAAGLSDRAVEVASKLADLAGLRAEKEAALGENLRKQIQFFGQIADTYRSGSMARPDAEGFKRLQIEQAGLVRDIAHSQQVAATAMESQRVTLAMMQPGFSDLARTTASIATNMALAFSPIGNLTGLGPVGAGNKPPRPPGGGGVDLVAEWKAKMAGMNPEGPQQNEAAAMRRLMRRLGVWGQTAGQEADVTSVVADQTNAVKALADEYSYLGSSIMNLAGPLGALSGGLGEVTRALGTGLTAAAQFTSGDILGGISSVLGGLIDLFGGTDKKARGIVRDAQLDTFRGGPQTVIINVAPGADPQSVAKAVRQSAYSQRGTGADSRSPGL